MKALLKCARKLKDNEFHSTLEKKSVDQSKSKNGDLSIASDKNSASESAVTNVAEKENRISTISNFGDRENRPSTMSINAGNRQHIFFIYQIYSVYNFVFTPRLAAWPLRGHTA